MIISARYAMKRLDFLIYGHGKNIKENGAAIMKWYEFLELRELEKVLIFSLFAFCKYVPWAIRRGTYAEDAFREFKYMWE